MNSVPREVARATDAYLRSGDRLAPGALVACAVSGSVALGAYRKGSSDIDLVALVGEEWRGRRDLLPRLRALHLSQLPRMASRVLRGLGVSALCNTVFIWKDDAGRPVSQIRPVASHVGEQFVVGRAFDVNPVIWTELAGGGIAVRGPDVRDWGLNPEPETLVPWTRKNLRGYWVPLADALDGRRRPLSADEVAWHVLGPARMHATLTSGEIISKDEAGHRARELFPGHAEVIDVALAGLRGEKSRTSLPRTGWKAWTSDVMREIFDAAGV